MEAIASLKEQMTKLAARVEDLRNQKTYIDREIVDAAEALRAMELAIKYISRAEANPPGPSFSFMQTVPQAATPAISERLRNASERVAKNKSDIMREAMDRLSDRFTHKDLFDAISAGDKEDGFISINDVSFFLSRIRKSGKIFIAEQGAGKTPSTYSKTDPALAA